MLQNLRQKVFRLFPSSLHIFEVSHLWLLTERFILPKEQLKWHLFAQTLFVCIRPFSVFFSLFICSKDEQFSIKEKNIAHKTFQLDLSVESLVFVDKIKGRNEHQK